ncbi:hypothetical protein SAMN06295912_10531 [Sphingomonas laterariae]|uniref:Uncharacterized protein n=1 Tax=Edaphosphingomonas laterariae TaxID=861865 RepID=A0A239DV37_9SPHN|nr:hypothetical protein SAMN06295912_10531 [Sphingomonas laterariae]
MTGPVGARAAFVSVLCVVGLLVPRRIVAFAALFLALAEVRTQRFGQPPGALGIVFRHEFAVKANIRFGKP